MSLSDDERIELIRRAVVRLCEHFSSVQVIAVRQCDDPDEGTTVHSWGQGSWFERYGAVRRWLLVEEESERENVRRDTEP